ncbi:hypothetical protein [Rhodobacter sp. CZR27]|uniref:hypothetical protein n=1 Tax=Rhodobacter sp. CZR27 TaxID=2033869 RepID=UPI000BBE46D5|nr:hypothetical protein [Rhodobacter sp. CZR27]
MLTVTTRAFAGVPDPAPFAQWPEPHVLIVLPDAELSQKAISRLNRTMIVIEHLEPPAGAFAMLADLPGWLGHHLFDIGRPLLFLDRPPAEAEIAGEARRGRAQPYGIGSELDGSGRLRLLRMGGMVASSPLLPHFLRFLKGRGLDDALSVDLLRTTFPDPGA